MIDSAMSARARRPIQRLDEPDWSNVMNPMRMLNILVLLLSLAGGIYYITADKDTQGAVVVLLGILYFLGVPQITRK
jgi:hypothetical protein